MGVFFDCVTCMCVVCSFCIDFKFLMIIDVISRKGFLVFLALHSTFKFLKNTRFSIIIYLGMYTIKPISVIFFNNKMRNLRNILEF